MEVKKLDFGETLKDSVAIGVKNAPSVIAAVALWLITIWIPYLNVGTTIAITLLPTQLAKGEIVNPLGIFDSKYRRYMDGFPDFHRRALHGHPGHRALDRMDALLLFPHRKGQKSDTGHQGFERRHLRQQMDHVLRVAGRRRAVRHRIRHFPGHLQRDRHRLHHVRRHVHPLRAGHLDLNVHQRFILETAERQRGVTRPESLQRRYCVPSFFGPFNHFYRKTINIICFSKINSIFATVKPK